MWVGRLGHNIRVRNEIARPSRDTSVEAGEGGIVDQLPGCTRLRPPVLFKYYTLRQGTILH